MLRLALTIEVRRMAFKEYLRHLREEWHAMWHGDDEDPFLWSEIVKLPVSKELSPGRHRLVKGMS